MKFNYSSKKLGDLKEVIGEDGGVTLKFNLEDEGKSFIDSLFRKSEETDEAEDANDAMLEMINNLIELASALSQSLSCMIDDGYSVSDFIIQTDLLGKVLGFFNIFNAHANEE
ncbi:MAG: hypothetical protein IJV59_03130 [Eubacterium sp.]|nr:hypothetical protein [Eubacterium sp.]MBQ9643638.1 hypothetical protein [Lachnospiraceae bacterium]